MDKRKLFFRAIVAIVVIGAIYRYFEQRPDEQAQYLTGQTMGTITYNIKYISQDQLIKKTSIDSILKEFNQSLSTYIPNSEISTLNSAGLLENPSDVFIQVLKASLTVHKNTSATFDPTVGQLVNAWGFGPGEKPSIPDSTTIKNLVKTIGLNRVNFTDKLVAMDTSMYLDFSAIAKGYAVDVVAKYLEFKKINSYLVEIGGEVRANGKKASGKNWTIGIEDPLVERAEQKLLAIVRLANMAMATSGNYRNYYKVGNKTIAHTIDPRTGYNTNHNLLSATVFADNCMEADAYATAFMVLGLEASKKVLESIDIDAFLVFQKEDGDLSSYVSKGIAPFVDLNKIEDQ